MAQRVSRSLNRGAKTSRLSPRSQQRFNVRAEVLIYAGAQT